MPKQGMTFAFAAIVTALVAAPLVAQAEAEVTDAEVGQAEVAAGQTADPLTASIQEAAMYLRHVYTTAAEQMSEEDYAFEPTPEVRSFGQLLAHVADSSFLFCARATGATPPVTDVESTRTTRADIQKALTESFDYCESAFAAMSDESKASAPRDFMGKPRPALAVLNFRNYHTLLHWGNVITYMRLRGKVPPSP